MDKKPRELWLSQQGYRPGKVPPRVTWYGQGKSFTGATDNYTVDLNRSKGYVLDPKFLDPQLWGELELCLARTRIAVHAGPPPDATPRLADAIAGTMFEKDFWEGTASELLTLINPVGEGIPKDAIRLSTEVMKPHITDGLKSYGITVRRQRSNGKRSLQFKTIAQ